ncbi:hypothetical protein [Halalkalibacter akibai]|uniref:Uncharacterized protein n=1 Tax=Halalkalibacter akibai (strain ATCC 43226 / DSM 21942 / CIP 109018 / JCM 9157 / 1139) TaxID=1236973 RepID=W4QZE1_HALA3|nr:hypothetical protein [Halalkalibacter akibai]GAE37431.1 hypothetical protein JCM9157_4730 [Halalkalibacter akibai JCM 9157]
MASRRRHVVFNLILILIPWVSVLFLGKKSFKRYLPASFIIGIFEILNHVYGHKRNFWEFYDKPKSFIRDELPFDIGPYIPLSMWILKYSYGNFKKFVVINAVANGFFAFLFMPFLKKIKIIRLRRLNYFQFFFYIHYKAYLLYGMQYLLERKNLRYI